MNTYQEKTLACKNESLASTVKRLGNPISTLLLDLDCLLFRIPDLDGIIGYQIYGNCAVVIGDPICLPANRANLTQAFQDFCRTQKWKIVYFLASEPFAHWAINNGCRTLIQVGEKLVVDPTAFRKKQKIRWKINQSVRNGVVIKEYLNLDPMLEKQMKNTIETWLKTKRGPQIYLGTITADTQEKRIFYAMQNNKIVGLLALSSIDLFDGWVVKFYLALDSPVGVTEHLMCAVIDTLAQDNCHFLCLGAASGSELGEIVGLSPFSKFAARCIFKLSKWLFNLDTRKKYLNKYNPNLSPTYILTSGKLSITELWSLKKTLNVKF